MLADIRNKQLALEIDAPMWAHLTYAALKHVTTIRRADFNAPLFAMLPYCLHAMHDRHERCVVNRDYKPFGMLKFSGEWLSYETATGQHISFEEFERLRAAGIVNEHGYLHNDGSSPRAGRKELMEYRRKLEAMIAPYVVQPKALQIPAWAYRNASGARI